MAQLDQKPKDFELKDNTAIKVVKSDVADKLEVEIGDALQPDFKPQFKIKRWDNEVNFSMRAEEDPTATVVVEDDKVKYKAKDYEVHQYEKPEAGEDGGFEFEWVLPKKPVSNVLTSTIQTKELNFFYQPELTQEEIDEGTERPENVVGSYAVYHKTKKNNKVGSKAYKTGKAFHIYRPEAVDADGVKTWCELDIDEQVGTLKVTVPQEYLDGAKYPVVVDPTFGYTSFGAGSSLIASNTSDRSSMRGNPYALSEAGTLDSMSAYLGLSSGTSESIDTYLALFREDSAGSGSHDLVASMEDLNASYTSTFGWKTINASSESLSVDDYIVAVLANGEDIATTSAGLSVRNDSASSDLYFESTTGAGSYATRKEDPWTETVSTSTFNLYSIYATYTASGGGGTADGNPMIVML